jgi:hypothetical protein
VRVLPVVLEDVDESIPHRPGRREIAGVVPVAPDGATTPEHTIHALCDADRESLHTTRERGCGVGLDDQVHVVALDGEGDHAERVT